MLCSALKAGIGNKVTSQPCRSCVVVLFSLLESGAFTHLMGSCALRMGIIGCQGSRHEYTIYATGGFLGLSVIRSPVIDLLKLRSIVAFGLGRH